MDTQELNKQIDELQKSLTEITSLNSRLGYGQYAGTDFFEKENERIERYLSDFTTREGVLLTIAGLFSLFPVFNINGALPYFLIWTIPFLFVAIITYICSSKRVNFIFEIDKFNPGLPDSEAVNGLLKKQYEKSLIFHRLTDAVLVSFFVSFVVNYYLFVFIGLSNLTASVLVDTSNLAWRY